LLLARLQAHGINDVVSVPTQAGIELSVLCADSDAASSFIAQVSDALATAVAMHDPALPLIEDHLAALRSRPFDGRAEATVAQCSGDVGLAPGTAIPDLHTAAGIAELERYRRATFAAQAGAFSAVGPNAFLDAVARALGKARDWPSGEAPSDAWPSGDALDVDAANGERRLAVALRVADADAALSSLPSLTAADSTLRSRLRAFLPGFRLDRVAFQARARGACLRADVALPQGEPAPTVGAVAEAASIVSEEMRLALGPGLNALDENIVEPSDPRQAAARAAWRALVGRQKPGEQRRFVAVSVHPTERANFSSLAGAVGEFEAGTPRAPVEARVQAEPGQGQLWLLLGSPCGTLGESNDEAGQSALALTLAAHAATGDVALEPWLTADAVGLLAHSGRNPGESPTQQAQRVARALGRALTEQSASGDALATAQSELLAAIGGAQRPGYARLLDALSPDHTAWLEPHGTFAALAQANRDSVSARARDLWRGPLRVAALGNQDEAQATTAAHTLQRWLAPWRDDPQRCQATPERAAHSGELALAVPNDGNAESAYVGLPFSSRLKYEREAQTLAGVLNVALPTAFAAAQMGASARASIIGGGRVSALVIEVHANEDDARKATLEVRRVLERVIQTPLSNDELASAQRTAEQHALAAALDPRRRIVDLWRGLPPDAPLSRNSVRAFQAILAGAAQVVVSVTQRD
jgi:hypothetical protein